MNQQFYSQVFTLQTSTYSHTKTGMFLAAILKNHQKLEIKFPSTGELLYIHKRNITQQYKGTTATLLNMDKPQWHYTECIYTIF